MKESIANQQAGCGKSKRYRHVKHGSLARLHTRFPHDLYTIGDGFYSGIRTSTQGESPQKYCQYADKTDCSDVLFKTAVKLTQYQSKLISMI